MCGILHPSSLMCCRMSCGTVRPVHRKTLTFIFRVKQSSSHKYSTLMKMTAQLPRQDTSPTRQQRIVSTGGNACCKQDHSTSLPLTYPHRTQSFCALRNAGSPTTPTPPFKNRDNISITVIVVYRD